MKLVLLSITSIMVCVSSSFCQTRILNKQTSATDTIQVSISRTTYLAFPADIELVDIGNKEYTFKVEKNILLLKSLKAGSHPTNMLVKFGQELFTASLIYAENNNRSLYDFRKKNFENGATFTRRVKVVDTSGFNSGAVISLTADTGVTDSLVSPKRVAAVKALAPHFKTYGIIKNSIAFLLGNMVSDDKFMYLQFQVINKSHLNYLLDYVSFEYKKYGSKGVSKAFEPLYTPSTREVSAHKIETLVYVIPLFASGSDGQFTVIFRESLGNRKAQLHIPTRAIKSALVFSHDIILSP